MLHRLALLFALCAPLLARAGFVNGQPAAFVLGQSNFTSSDSSPVSSHYFGAQDVAVDPRTGKVFVVDKWAHRILRYATADGLTLGAAPEAVFGQVNLNSFTPGSGAAQLNAPNAIAIDRAGALWVADQANNRVLRFPRAATVASGASATLVLGQTGFNNSGSATTPAGMNAPAGLCVDSNGTLWVADQSNNRVLRFDDVTVKTNGANADGVLGQSGFVTSNSGSDAQGMILPAGVVTAANGALFVADWINSRVLRFDAAAGKPDGAAADHVLGQPTLSGGFSGSTRQRIASPLNLDLDANGTLAMADKNNHRVLLWASAATLADYAPATAVLGQPDFTSTGTSISRTTINDPASAKFDVAGRLWAADSSARRVLRFDPSTLAANAFQPGLAVERSRRAVTFRLTNLGQLPAGFTLTGSLKFKGKARLKVKWTLDGANATAALKAGALSTPILAAKSAAVLISQPKRVGKKIGRLKVTISLVAKSASYPALTASARTTLKL